jgi:ATP synthase j chain
MNVQTDASSYCLQCYLFAWEVRGGSGRVVDRRRRLGQERSRSRHVRQARIELKLQALRARSWRFIHLTNSSHPNPHRSVKMPGFWPKKYPGKMGALDLFNNPPAQLTFLTAEPMIPFFAAGVIVLYAINAGANAMMKCKFRRRSRRTLFQRVRFKHTSIG